MMEKLHLTQFVSYLKPRPRDAHKGMYGHVLIVGGDSGFSGAPRLAAEAALRVGAGLVSVATKPDHALNLNNARPEIMCHGVRSGKELKPLLSRATVVIIGPGLGQSTWSRQCWLAVKKSEKPMVVDADGLNMLAKGAAKNPHWILTPHPGEAARLLNKKSSEDIQADRLSAAKKIQEKYNGVCVLKGAGTLVVTSENQAICEAGNPGMATAGMGDVLSGVIGGFLAQGMPLAVAAKCGVLIHALAGDLAAKDGERGMLAMDLFSYLRRWVNLR